MIRLQLVPSLLAALGSALVAALGPPSRLGAQEAPPPTAEDLRIYALAVDSSAYPQESSIMLLQERTLRVEADGTWTVRLRVVRQILTQAAVSGSAELSFGYDPEREEFSLDWARVVHADGGVVSAGPVHVQELDEPVSRSTPVYSDNKRVRATLGDVAVGRIVDWRSTQRVTDPPLPGDVFLRWYANGTTPLRRSRFVLDTPETLDVHIAEENLDGPTSVRQEGGRLVREWSYEDVAAVESEPFAADSNGVVQRVTVGPPMEWDEVARWYTALTRDRYSMTPELEARLSDLVADARTLDDSLRAVHRWIAQDVRYASISLGIG
ncbi:MAG TPA: DUF3857 domain-containing protein, partial [Longimicrobiales bacterium]|nr:DUF3857 domain-containing protein [Longimicrobiales bacterium]